MAITNRGASILLAVSLMVSYCAATLIITVDQYGRGNYLKIQQGIDAVPSNSNQAALIRVKPGIYREKVVVPIDKPFITLTGTSDAVDTIITWNDGGSIFESPTLAILASNVTLKSLTVENSCGEGKKAVALRVSGDRVSIQGCRIFGYQDTLLDDRGRHFYDNCFIQGATDFICGNAASLFQNCHLHTLSVCGGAITAQSRQSPDENTGFTFLKCKITGVEGARAVLGRPWGAYSRVVMAFTYMTNAILPQGWDNWRDPSKERTAYYGEYKCYGQGADESARVSWSRSLTSLEVQPFLSKNIIDSAAWIQPAPNKPLEN